MRSAKCMARPPISCTSFHEPLTSAAPPPPGPGCRKGTIAMCSSLSRLVGAPWAYEGHGRALATCRTAVFSHPIAP